MRRLPWSFPKKTPVLLLFVLACVACGKEPESNSLCLKSPAQANNSASQLLALNDPGTQLAASGAAYLDLKTTDSSGQVLQRRCSVMLAPDDADAETVKIWTAHHCLYNTDSTEFENTKFTLQVFYLNGYVSYPIRFEGIAELGRVAQQIKPVLPLLPARERSYWHSTMSEGSVKPCQQQTRAFAAALGSDRKNIACFSMSEIRVLRGKVQTTEKTRKHLEKVIDVVGKRFRDAKYILPEREKRSLAALERSLPLSSARLPLAFRTYGYWFNEKHCSTAPGQLPRNDQGVAQTQSFCSKASEYRNLLKAAVPEYYPNFAEVADAKLATLSDLEALHQSVFGCQFESLDDFNKGPIEVKTECDRDRLNRLIWNNLVKSGAESLAANSLERPSVFGFNPQSYFTILFNDAVVSLHSNSSKNAARGNILPITPAIGTLSPRELNNAVILINFDNQKGLLRLKKSDSGSILSIFGTLPIGTLSTLDEEPTSGGASILPLPSHTEEEEILRPSTSCK